ncbi:uncharacterized protein L201_005219 [Kwoniella dendrophila CBS 6074]|uniref:Ricin B lectin domain-containing protein n=1 Tax=Kwoniella dendrophila CBS 6074 TaxID=1295534 RepID=A0AAX4JY00_9TREE
MVLFTSLMVLVITTLSTLGIPTFLDNFNLKRQNASSCRPEVSPNIPYGQVYEDHPIEKGQRIHPYGRPDLCVMVQHGVAGANQLMDIAYCLPYTSPYVSLQLWNITQGISTRVFLQAHPDLCLAVAGPTPRNGARLQTYGCGNTSKKNQLCLDVERDSPITLQQPYDKLQRLQIWSCIEGNPQQEFTILG